MPIEIAVPDIQQLYQHSLVMYKNKPVYIINVAANGNVQYLDLYSQKELVAPFSLKEFLPPARRLGMVNVKGSVVYAYRVPVRKYKVGIMAENLKVCSLDIHYPAGAGRTKQFVLDLQTPAIADALANKYPSLEQCIEHLKEFDGAMAFDKQFAITGRGNYIFYKTVLVGRLPPKSKKIEDIAFTEEYKHLGILLNNNFEKPIVRKV